MQFEAEVLDVREESRFEGRIRWQLLLDRTGFSTGGQGWLEAVAPSGTRLRVRVLSVVEGRSGELWHVVDKPLAMGTVVRGSGD